jgi:hypothetical protein
LSFFLPSLSCSSRSGLLSMRFTFQSQQFRRSASAISSLLQVRLIVTARLFSTRKNASSRLSIHLRGESESLTMACLYFVNLLSGQNTLVCLQKIPVIIFRNYLHDIQSSDLLLDALRNRIYSHTRHGFNHFESSVKIIAFLKLKQ